MNVTPGGGGVKKLAVVNFKITAGNKECGDFMWEHEYELYEEDINQYNK